MADGTPVTREKLEDELRTSALAFGTEPQKLYRPIRPVLFLRLAETLLSGIWNSSDSGSSNQEGWRSSSLSEKMIPRGTCDFACIEVSRAFAPTRLFCVRVLWDGFESPWV